MTRCSRMTTRRIRMDEQFAKTLKDLRLWGVLAHWDQYVALAEQQDFSPIRLLRHVLEEESKLHAANSRRLRLLRAQIPDPWRMETFPFERQPNLNKKRLLSLRSEEHTSELQSQFHLVCRLLLEKKKNKKT